MKKVLIVEDAQDLVRGMTIRLRQHGFTCFVAPDGVSVVPLARRERPDVILLDLGLPAGDGFVVLERLQSIASLAAIPVIVLTARDPESSRPRAMQAGAAAFLRKPVPPDLLLDVLRFATGDSETENRSAA